MPTVGSESPPREWPGQEPAEDLVVSQAIVRNLVRLVDFLPLYYAVGAVTMFVNQRGQRLGDLAAGTVVVRDRGAISLPELIVASQRTAAAAPAAPPPVPVVGRR